MRKANPPPFNRLPMSIIKNKDLADTLNKIIFDMFLLWEKVGGGADFIQDNTNGFTEFDDIKKIDLSSLNDVNISLTSLDYTTYTSETIICTAPVNITLNNDPSDGEMVRVKITNGDVNITSNKLIDEQQSIVIIFKNVQGYPMIDLFYSIDTDKWYIL